MRQVVHVTNLAVGLVVCPLYFFQTTPVAWHLIWQPAAMSLFFYYGGWLTVWAMRYGDVSLVTPLMGTKVVFVALGSVVFLGEQLPGLLIAAAALTAIGIFTLGVPDMARSKASFGPATLLALLSVAMFACCDLMVKQWAQPFGKYAFIGLASNGVAVISGIDILLRRLPGRERFVWPGKGTRFWIWSSACLIAVQATALGVVLATTGDATGVNVVYASRGLWVILLVWLIGHWFANHERRSAGKFYIWRVVGSVLLTAAVIMAVIARAG
ncbi:MAG: drug/metabolite transporter (DMT)-like permease [Verrucomicrobiales bacterium]|jgi:drug/metabolite transporter (DMT)-like permease